MKCPKCGYPHADVPKCRACGAEITAEELPSTIPVSIPVEEPSEPTAEEKTTKRKKK